MCINFYNYTTHRRLLKAYTPLDYIDEVFGDKSLWPTDPYEKAIDKVLVNDFGGKVHIYMSKLLQAIIVYNRIIVNLGIALLHSAVRWQLLQVL